MFSDGWWAGPIERRADFAAADELYQSTFGYASATHHLNPLLLVALVRNGGSAVGVKTPDGALVGFAYGFHAADGSGDYHYSQAAFIHPDVQGRGVGVMLKHAQRELVLATTGVQRMRWSFSPFLVRNAIFNLEKLGAAAIAFSPDYYDAPGSQRLIVEWSFDRAVAAAPSAVVAPTEQAPPDGVRWRDEPAVAGARWLVFPASVAVDDGPARAAMTDALGAAFADGARITRAARVGADTAAYLVEPVGSRG